jgi:adenine-specific DNA-methyltransferase
MRGWAIFIDLQGVFGYPKANHGGRTMIHAKSAGIQLVNSDAEAFLKGLPDDSVDLLITSPPYFVGKEYDRSSSVSDFEDEIIRTLDLVRRKIKPGGSMCWQVGYHVRDNLVVPLDVLIYNAVAKYGEFKLRNRIVWTFGHGTHSPRRFSGRHETILWFTNGDGYTFDLDSVRVPQKYPGKKHYKGPNKGEWSGNPAGKNPEDVWDIPNVKARHVEKTDHPCQYPVGLVRRLVRALAPEGGLVIDPYMGVGSTALACALEGRRFAGSEIDERYVRIARERMKALRCGTLKLRDDRPARKPVASESVAKAPPHFAGFEAKHGS